MKPNHNQPKCEHCSVKEPMSFCEGIIGPLVEPMVPMKSEQDTLIGMHRHADPYRHPVHVLPCRRR